jgi:hypothetical protein
MKNLSSEQIDILKTAYAEKLSDIRQRKEFDFKLVCEYAVLNLVCAGALIAHPINDLVIQIAVLVLLATVAVLASLVIGRNTKRHKVVAESIRNVAEALGLGEEGLYIQGRSIEPSETNVHRAWNDLYYSLIWLFFFAQALILFRGIE